MVEGIALLILPKNRLKIDLIRTGLVAFITWFYPRGRGGSQTPAVGAFHVYKITDHLIILKSGLYVPDKAPTYANMGRLAAQVHSIFIRGF